MFGRSTFCPESIESREPQHGRPEESTFLQRNGALLFWFNLYGQKTCINRVVNWSCHQRASCESFGRGGCQERWDI
eukprot:4729371-Karenia_brevis.AAC.1